MTYALTHSLPPSSSPSLSTSPSLSRVNLESLGLLVWLVLLEVLGELADKDHVELLELL